MAGPPQRPLANWIGVFRLAGTMLAVQIWARSTGVFQAAHQQHRPRPNLYPNKLRRRRLAMLVVQRPGRHLRQRAHR